MRILIINVVCGVGSTGKICAKLATELEKEGHEVKIAYGRGKVPEEYEKYAVKIGTNWEQSLHAIRTRVLDEHGFGSKKATASFLKWAEEYDPDILWLHNIHGYYINVELLFDWIKQRSEMQIKWTLHDCWAFTGHCAYFTMAECEKWQEYCINCEQKGHYPSSVLIDNCKQNFQRKKNAFTGIKNMMLITPSQWLADLVKKSFLKEYPIEVCYNTIDTSVFKPTPSDFRQKYQLEEKKIILGVASVWDERKGLRDFARLAKMLDDSYAIVLVGLSEKQIVRMPSLVENISLFDEVEYAEQEEPVVLRTTKGVAVLANVRHLYTEITGEEFNKEKLSTISSQIFCFPKAHNPHELAEFYTVADWFVNPTREDNFPTVNLEAIACGTYVITYATGGCAETLYCEGICENTEKEIM